MIVYFSSASGFTHRFVEKLELPAQRIPTNIKEAALFEAPDKFVLIVPTYELHQVHGSNAGVKKYLPEQVARFLNNPANRAKMVGVIGTGNRNFYDEFAYSADVIHKKTNTPILYRVELEGSDEDVLIVKEGLNKFWDQLS